MRIALVGCGNVATHLAGAITASSQAVIAGIFNRTLSSARILARSLAVAHASSDFGTIADLAPDFVIISVADNAVSEIVRTIGKLSEETVVVLTSGTVSMDVLRPLTGRVGVLYPLQTFSKGCKVDMSDVPIFTEASDEASLKIIDRVAAMVGGNVVHADGSLRRRLHIAGVLVNNFVNILLEEAEGILAAGNLGLKVVHPLVRETVRKAFAIGPHQAQTGPARRGDEAVIAEQIAGLEPRLKPAYIELTKLIAGAHHREFNI